MSIMMASVTNLRRVPLTRAEQTTLWERLMGSASLADLPYKVETDPWGGIRLTPTERWHWPMVRRMRRKLEKRLGGEAQTEVAIVTDIGVKVADVAWCSESFLDEYWSDTALLHAPEICIEVVSPSNAECDLHDKIRAYLSTGAIEVWLVTESGAADIYDVRGLRDASQFLLGSGSRAIPGK